MTWRPAFCESPKCVLEYQPIDGVLDQGDVKYFTKSLNRCSAHANVPEAELHATLLAESRFRENVRFLLHGELIKVRTALKPEEISLIYDAKRDLLVSWEGITTTEKNAVRSLLPAGVRIV